MGRENCCCHGRSCKVFWDQNSHCRGPMGGVIGEGDGKPVSFFCPWCFPASLRTASSPPAPPELACLQPVPSVVPSRSCPSALCTEGSEWPLSRRPVYQLNNGKLVLLEGIQHLSLQTSSLQRGPAMPSPRNPPKLGLLCILINFLPPTTLNAFNLLLQMANFENPLIRIRSSTSIFIYFPFS